MAKNEDKKTEEKLIHLKNVMGIENEPEKKENEATSNKNNKPTEKIYFKTSEVAFLLVITTIISLIMGSVITNKLNVSEKEYDKNLKEFISNYEYITKNYNGKIDKEELIDGALEGMLEKLDKNSTYLEKNQSNKLNIQLEGSYKGLGITIYNDDDNNIKIYSILKNSPAEKAGLKPGDTITKLNDENVSKMKTSKFTKKVKKLQNKQMKITYKRDDKENTIKINMEKINLQSVESKTFTKENKKIGYIGVSIFASNTDIQFKKHLDKLEKENIDSLIIDLRANSGGYLSSATEMISQFLDKSHVIYQIQKGKTKTKQYSVGTKTKKYKIVMLVDQNSASASEVMTSALKEQYGATIVGKKTYGKGTVQELQTLSNGDKYKVTTKNWLTSKGKWINEKGINPDVEIDFDTKYYDNPSDENDVQLQKALEEASK